MPLADIGYFVGYQRRIKEVTMFSRVLKWHDSTLFRYRRLGLINSTIAWLLFAEGIFVFMMFKVSIGLIAPYMSMIR